MRCIRRWLKTKRWQQLPVLDGVIDWVGVTLRQPLSGPVAKGTIPSVRLTLPESLQAGFGTQEAIGVAELIDGDATIATALLYPAQSVGERTFLTGLGQARPRLACPGRITQRSCPSCCFYGARRTYTGFTN